MENSGNLKSAVDRTSIGKGLLFIFQLFYVLIQLRWGIEITKKKYWLRIGIDTSHLLKSVMNIVYPSEISILVGSVVGNAKLTKTYVISFSTSCIFNVSSSISFAPLVEEINAGNTYSLASLNPALYWTGWTLCCRKGELRSLLQIIQVCALSFTQ